MILVSVEGFSRGKNAILGQVTLSLEAGKIVAVVGLSGSGKTTLLRMLAEIEEPGAEGHIQCGSHLEVLPLTGNGRLLFTFMPQTPTLLPWKTVLENIALGSPTEDSFFSRQTREMASKLLKHVGLEEVANRYPFEISPGMGQRVAFARALSTGTPALLLDEPFSALDAHTRLGLQHWLKDMVKSTNRHVLLVTHDIREAIFLADEIHVLGGAPTHIIATLHPEVEHRENPIQLYEMEKKIVSLLEASTKKETHV